MARVRVLEPQARSPGRVETETALTLAQRLPRLILRSRRVAASLSHGIHGRRRAGIGETFWQFRPFVVGEAAQRIDWRRSGRDDRAVCSRARMGNGAKHLDLDRSFRLHGLCVGPGAGAENRARRWFWALRSATPLWKAASASACLA